MLDAPRTWVPAAGRWRVRSIGRTIAALRTHAGLVPVLAVAAVLYVYKLDQNGLGNLYYSAAVKSMSASWSAFFFGSIDTSNFITVDKPPAALWLQALSVRAFGFSSWSLLLPEALAGVASVGVLYLAIVRPWGRLAATIAAIVLALTPVTAATVRVNLPDSVLVLLLILSGWAAMRAVESGGLRWAIASAVFVGLAFNVKMLQAFIVVPALALVFIIAAPGSLLRRIAQLSVAGAVLLAVSASWMLIVDALPDGSKPYIGGSTDGTVRDLVLGYNGLGRITGNERGGPPGDGAQQGPGRPAIVDDGVVGDGPQGVPPNDGSGSPQRGSGQPQGPGSVPGDAQGARPGAIYGQGDGPAPIDRERPFPANPATGGGAAGPADGAPPFQGGRPGGGGPSFGGNPGWMRLFHDEVGTQVAWFLPFAAGGALFAFLVRGRAKRTDTKRAAALFWLAWTAIHVIVFSKAQGIFHPYYTSALAPGIAALCGIGVVAAITSVRRWWWSIFPLAAVFGLTLFTELALVDRASEWRPWLPPLLIAGTGVAMVIVCVATLVPTFLQRFMPRLAPFGGLMTVTRRAVSGAILAGAGVFVLAPAMWSFSVIDANANGTTPNANPMNSGGNGGRGGNVPAAGFDGGNGPNSTLNAGLVSYLEANRGSAKWIVAVSGAQTAAPIIIQTGEPVMAMGGFSGGDPAPTQDDLRSMIAKGGIRFFLTGGVGPGGQGINSYVTSQCKIVPPATYGGTTPGGAGRVGFGQSLYDCGTLAEAPK